MKGKFLFGTGIAAGYVLGSRSGRAAYEKLKSRAAALWESKPVQDKITAASEAVREKAPEVSEQLSEAARRAGTVIGSAVHREDSRSGGGKAPEDGPSTAAASGGTIPAHSTHPETVNLGTTSSAAARDVETDPALNDQTGRDWSDEGGAAPTGAATNANPDKSA
ncbi:hypothetical protein QFZ79_000826 [Arthrobacter sp. V4I6]|uniref:hypothetical protein n=1 Tax=unclassified Arthrobacter TaxID=235627 RepID=UPI002780FFE5|nr:MULTISPECIES: hypothetical protein [unclassified Arthrobacter]MDQ0823083.1 hypothetical protein [Arthrobacter sp. V1I7]MDQ0852715.1 hypothetical protein [Arthrobacter sp. V4I6]